MNTELKIVMQNEVGTAIGNDNKSLCVVWKNEDEQNNDLANLIIDAGNTVQSCGLLPSELLKQRNEALELFQDINSEIIAGSKIDYATVLHHRILGFLKSAEVNP